VNIDATPDTIRATAAALGKARLLDDKLGNADQARIAAWAEVVEPHKLCQQDLLEAVGAFYVDNPVGRTIQVGDLIHHARQVRRERAEREPDELREARQAALDAKAAEDDAERTTWDGPLKHSRPPFNPLMHRCPHCGARPGTHCTVPGTNRPPHDGTHPSREDAARQAQSRGAAAANSRRA
jgi:hypothetical protein